MVEYEQVFEDSDDELVSYGHGPTSSYGGNVRVTAPPPYDNGLPPRKDPLQPVSRKPRSTYEAFMNQVSRSVSSKSNGAASSPVIPQAALSDKRKSSSGSRHNSFNSNKSSSSRHGSFNNNESKPLVQGQDFIIRNSKSPHRGSSHNHISPPSSLPSSPKPPAFFIRTAKNRRSEPDLYAQIMKQSTSIPAPPSQKPSSPLPYPQENSGPSSAFMPQATGSPYNLQSTTSYPESGNGFLSGLLNSSAGLFRNVRNSKFRPQAGTGTVEMPIARGAQSDDQYNSTSALERPAAMKRRPVTNSMAYPTYDFSSTNIIDGTVESVRQIPSLSFLTVPIDMVSNGRYSGLRGPLFCLEVVILMWITFHVLTALEYILRIIKVICTPGILIVRVLVDYMLRN